MNLPTKLTVLRIILALIVMVLLMFPFDAVEISIPVIRAGIDMDLRYIISGVIFIIASFTDFLDGYLARKWNVISDFGKLFDPLADKAIQISAVICGDLIFFLYLC